MKVPKSKEDNITIGRAHSDSVCLSISSIDGASIVFLLKGSKFCLCSLHMNWNLGNFISNIRIFFKKYVSLKSLYLFLLDFSRILSIYSNVLVVKLFVFPIVFLVLISCSTFSVSSIFWHMTGHLTRKLVNIALYYLYIDDCMCLQLRFHKLSSIKNWAVATTLFTYLSIFVVSYFVQCPLMVIWSLISLKNLGVCGKKLLH